MKTKKIRILVAIDRFGNWNAAGGDGISEDELMRVVHLGMDFERPDPAYHWITAEVPIPETSEIAGVVE